MAGNIVLLLIQNISPDSDWIIHLNQLLMTKFGRILHLMNRRRQKC